MFVDIYVTCANKKEAEKISLHLLKKRLIACANIFPINSVYRWKGEIEKSKEYALLAKSKEKNFKKIKSEVERLHSYETPVIEKIKIDVNAKTKKWIEKEVK